MVRVNIKRIVKSMTTAELKKYSKWKSFPRKAKLEMKHELARRKNR